MLESGDGGPGLRNPWRIGIAADGLTVVVAGKGTLAVYTRDPVTGGLALIETYFANDAGIPDLDWPSGLLVSPGSDDIYYGSDTAAVVFGRQLLGDDFETGGTAAWSATVP